MGFHSCYPYRMVYILFPYIQIWRDKFGEKLAEKAPGKYRLNYTCTFNRTRMPAYIYIQ